MELGRFMGSLHPALIHFPIVLLLLAVGLEAIEFFRPHEKLAFTARLLLLLGTVSALFAFVCGNFAEIWAARSGVSQDAMEYHELLATVTSWSFVGLTAWRMLMKPAAPRPWRAVWLGLALGACVLLGYTGHRGAMLVYGRGAAVQDVGLIRPPTHEDLATLLQRQNPASILYSNMMHHVFGVMVLLISLLLLLEQVSPRLVERARRFGPLLLLAGGAFLLVFSDQDAWPLYHVRPFRPIYDKEVLLHKTYAVLMLVLGAAGTAQFLMRRVRDAQPWRVQGRTMAVFALVGGALLFTHVHSAAPYANVAVGVYIHHTVLGLFALAIGAVRLLDDRSVRPARWRALAFPALMAVESVFLMNYNEGLPWFLGYRHLSTAGAHGGLVAPLGRGRAELVYNPATSRMEVYLMRMASAEPTPIAAQAITAVVRIGGAATEVMLPANPGREARSAHFAANVPFVAGAPLFQVEAAVPGPGRTATAVFEPWIDRSQIGPPHSSLPYVCPMHPEVGSATPGRCPVPGCDMTLVPRGPARPTGVLHDDRYEMELKTEPAVPATGLPVRLELTPRDRARNAVLTDLDVVHTKKLHLIIVSRDLALFDHVHPVQHPDGSLVLDYRFPSGGDYVLFADMTPAGAPNQVFRLPLHVEGPAPAPTPLVESPAPAGLFGDYRVELRAAPDPPRAKDEAVLAFTLTRNGRPVTDLEPLLGAAGHCVVIRQDTMEYLHCHPVEPLDPAGVGPTVRFHTRFPVPGLYKVWGQFSRAGTILTADFVLRVE